MGAAMDPEEKYPLHIEFKSKQQSMEVVRDFIEWLIERTTNFSPRGPLPQAFVDEVRAKRIEEMTDQEKEKAILAFFEIDRDEFYKEKDLMVEELRKPKRKP